MFPQLEQVISPDTPIKDKVAYFSNVVFLHGASVDEQQSKVLKKKIVDLIASQVTRLDGLLLFEAALQQDTPFYVPTWPEIVLANLSGSNAVHKEITYRIIKMVVKFTIFERHYQTLKFHIPKILDIIMASPESCPAAAIESLASCIKALPGIAFTQYDSLQKFLFSQMNSNSPQICEAAADCFVTHLHNLSICKPPVSYLYSYHKTLYTLQDIFNKLLDSDNTLSIEGYSEDIETFPLPEMPSNQFSYIMGLSRLFSTLSTSAAKMICTKSDDGKPFEVPVLWMLEFVSRVIDRSKYVMKQKSSSTSELLDLLKIAFPYILKGVFIILESLLRNFELLEHVESLLQLICDCIELSYEVTFSSLSNYQIRHFCWKILNIWVDKNGGHVSCDTLRNQFIIEELLKDCMLNIKGNSMIIPYKPQSIKKSAADFAFNAPDENSDFNQMRLTTFIEALKVLNGLLYSGSPYIDNKVKEKIAESVLLTAKIIERQRCFPYPYMNETCRKKLFELCLTILLSSNFPVPINVSCLAVLRVAQKDPSLEIRRFTRDALSSYRHVLHPSKKFPEAITNSKVRFQQQTSVEEMVCDGWDTEQAWKMSNHVEHGGHVAQQQQHVGVRPENHKPSETHSIVVESTHQGGNYISEKVYYDGSYSKRDVQCNGDNMSEVQVSSQSESESEGDIRMASVPVGNSTNKPFISSVRTMGSSHQKEIALEGDEESEEDNLSVEEGVEEGEYMQLDEEEIIVKPANNRSAVFENGLESNVSVSEEEMLSSSKGENGDYSSEGEGSYEEEDEEEDDGAKVVDEQDEEMNEEQDEMNEDQEELVEEEEDANEEINEVNEEEDNLNEEDEKQEEVSEKQEIAISEQNSHHGKQEEAINKESEVVITKQNSKSGKPDTECEKCLYDILSDLSTAQTSEPPLKKQKVAMEIQNEIEEVFNTVEVTTEISSENTEKTEEEESRSKSPTFEEMCNDLVLGEPVEVAES